MEIEKRGSMRRAESVVISELSDAPAPSYLYGRIIGRIERWKRRSALLRALSFSSLCIFSLIGFVNAASYAADEFYLSGFTDYLRLLFTDSNVILDTWREFALTLVQSLPALPLAACSALLCLFVWSLMRGARDISILLARAA